MNMKMLFCVLSLIITMPSFSQLKEVKGFATPKSDDNSIIFIGGKLLGNLDAKRVYENSNILTLGFRNTGIDELTLNINKILPKRAKQVVFFTLVEDLLASEHPDSIVSKTTNLMRVIETKMPETNVVLVGLTPVSPVMQRKFQDNNVLLHINAGLSKANNSKNISFCNAFYELVNEEGELETSYTLDGIYLNREGQLALKSYLEGYLR